MCTGSPSFRRPALELSDAPPGPPGEALRIGLVALPTVRTRPNQAEALAFFIGEQVGEDRSSEARVVKLEAEIVAALVGALGPSGPDLDLMSCTT